VQLMDFGLAKVIASHAQITASGVGIGTPDYMSPEQAMGKTVDARSDVFSAGAVFYEFLTFQKPFKGRTLHAVLYQIISERPEPILTLNPEIPARLAACVERMLRKDPEQRYASMEEVVRDLSAIHASLRRSRSRSALPGGVAPLCEDSRARVREFLARSRSELEAGDPGAALSTIQEALGVDPGCEEAIELSWRSIRRLPTGAELVPIPDPESEARVASLLGRAAPGRPAEEARAALAELALIAPDDPRLVALVRERAGH
jgi:serine/threonine protein kinase